MAYKDIRAQIQALEKEAEVLRAQEVEGAVQKVRALIKEYNLTLADIGKTAFGTGRMAKAGRKAYGPKPPKYRNPATGATWSGFGKRPRWIADAMAKGKGDEYLIANEAVKPAKPAAKTTQKAEKPVSAKKTPGRKPAAKVAKAAK